MASSSTQIESEDDYISFSSDSEAEADQMSKDLINFRSPRFNALLSLNLVEHEVEVPIKNAPRYLNLHQYEKAMKDPKNAPAPLKTLTTEDIKTKTCKDPKDSQGKSAESVQEFPMSGRRFLPHQMPVYRPRKDHPNTLTLMRDAKGPLSLLTKVMNEKKRVKVWTRSIDCIRGYCVGYVEAFDKHWNLALRDVDELFQRKRKIKHPATCMKMKEEPNHLLEGRIQTESMKLEQCVRKTEKKDNSGVETLASDKKDFSQKKPVLIGGKDAIKICRIGLDRILTDEVPFGGGGTGSRIDRETTTQSSIPQAPCQNVSSSSTETNQKQSHSQASDINFPSKAQIKKRGLTVFQKPYKDHYGFLVIGQSKKYEIVQRHVGQLFLMGNDVVLIEVLQ